MLAISHQCRVLGALPLEKTVPWANHAFVAKLERVRGGCDRRFRLDNARDLRGLVILVDILDSVEDSFRRVGENILASLCLDARGSTNHGCHGTTPYMATTQHLVVCQIRITNESEILH